MIVNRSMYPIQAGFSAVSKLQESLGRLETQLGTGKKAGTLAEMGKDRSYSLSIREQLNRFTGYGNTMDTVNLRLSMLNNSLQRLDEIEGDTRISMTPNAYGDDGLNLVSIPKQARARLDEVITLLNTSANGRYLLGGNRTEQAPLPSIDELLNGVGGRAGFATVVNERNSADLGADHMGRLTVGTSSDAGPPATSTVTLAEDGVHPFGFKISTVSDTSDAIDWTVATASPSTPGSLGVTFTDQPKAGETVTIGLTLPDGTTTSLTLTASNEDPKGPHAFKIGADIDETAANFAAVLKNSIQGDSGTPKLDVGIANTELKTASSFAAANNFFNGQGEPILRVSGSPPETATSLRVGTASDTVQWYSGEDSADPRRTVGAKIDEGTRVDYGVQANEKGFAELMRTLAVATVTTYPTDDDTSKGRYDALALRQMSKLSESHNGEDGSIEIVATELGIAQNTIGKVTDRQKAFSAQLNTMLETSESVTPEQVAMELLAVKTRLEASYAAMASISQLSLANYLK